MNTIPKARHAVLAQAIIVGLLLGGTAWALPAPQAGPSSSEQNTTPMQVNIPAQPLRSALDSFAHQTGLQVVYAESNIVSGLHAPAVKGMLPPAIILQKLLAPSNLHFTFVNKHTVTVFKSGPKHNGDAIKRDMAPDPQPQADTGKNAVTLESVTVTGSRILRPDLSLPTPVVPVSRSELRLSTHTSVATALDELPQFRPTVTGATSQGTILNAGRESLDLRGLGEQRTLVLMDGRRFIGSNDMNTIPSLLIRDVQIITGGASATWGSDAVAGVVNVRLDNEFVGFDANVNTGISNHSDGEQYRAGIKWGTSYADGGGHFIIGADFGDLHGIGLVRNSRGGIAQASTLPIGNGREKVFPHVGRIDQLVGGVITSGTFADHVFEPDGSLRSRKVGNFTSGAFTSGGDRWTLGYPAVIFTPSKHYSILAHNSFDLSPNLKLVTQVQFSKMYERHASLGDPDTSDVTIHIDNAFLPRPIRQIMQSVGENSFTMRRADYDVELNPDNPGPLALITSRKEVNFTVGLEGTVGYWHWVANYVHGQTNFNESESGQIRGTEYLQAIDSVIDPASGQPICRIALTNPGTNCVPFNPFGYGSPSQAAQRYVTGASMGFYTMKLDVLSASVSGEPFELPAGLASVAFGVNARRESEDVRVGPDDKPGIFRQYHQSPLKGSYNVKEAFGELFVPLLNDRPFAHDLSIDLAARISDYTGSGSVWSYKGGFNDEIVEGFRFRADYSQDIRAANAQERFTEGHQYLFSVIDPVTDQAMNVSGLRGGNPNLSPEKAKTFTSGFSWTPLSLPGFAASVDYYNIKIKDVITTLGAQDVLDRCAAGTASICNLVTRDANGNIVGMNVSFMNLAQQSTDGVDLDFSYKRPANMFGKAGNLHARLMTTWVHKLSQFDGVNRIKYVGSTSGIGGPRWRSLLTGGFEGEDFSIYGRVRHLSPTLLNRTRDIVNGQIGSYFYFDIGAEVRLAKHVQLRFDVRNLTDRQPTIVTAMARSYYDLIGRYFTAGLKVHF